MDRLYGWMEDSFIGLWDLGAAYLEEGEKIGIPPLMLWLWAVPILLGLILYGTNIKRPFAAFLGGIFGHAVLVVPLIDAIPYDTVLGGCGVTFLRCLAVVVPAFLGWWFPRIVSPLYVGWCAAMASIGWGAAFPIALSVWMGVLVLLEVGYGLWYPHLLAVGCSLLLAFLTYSYPCPLRLPLMSLGDWRWVIGGVQCVFLSWLGIHWQRQSQKRRQTL